MGYNLGRIESSYATGTVTGTSKVGGLVGWNDSGTISGKNYWRQGRSTIRQGIGIGRGGSNVKRKTDAELKALDARSTGWSTAIWNFEAGKYPKL